MGGDDDSGWRRLLLPWWHLRIGDQHVGGCSGVGVAVGLSFGLGSGNGELFIQQDVLSVAEVTVVRGADGGDGGIDHHRCCSTILVSERCY